jgi:uncharacterized membrane protein
MSSVPVWTSDWPYNRLPHAGQSCQSVGAMVVSPFAGSSLSASVGVVSGNLQSTVKSIRSQFLGLAVAIVSATAAAFVFRWGYLVTPTLDIGLIAVVGDFSTPVSLTLVIAVVAGAAGALALSTDLPVAIAGVAVAAAIVPAAAATGIGIVWPEPLLALGAFALLIVNVTFINLTAFIALLGFGYRPSDVGGLSETLSLSLRMVVAAVAAVALVVIVVAVLFTTPISTSCSDRRSTGTSTTCSPNRSIRDSNSRRFRPSTAPGACSAGRGRLPSL